MYFKNKEDLLEKLYDEIKQVIDNVKDYAMSKQINKPSERFAYCFSASLWTYQKYRNLSKIMLIEAVGLNRRF